MKKQTRKILSLVLALVMLVSMIPVPVLAEENSTAATYEDGTYTKTATVYPDEYEDFTAYDLNIDVIIDSGKITKVAFSEGNTFGDEDDNETYSNKALNGRGKYVGVAAQIIEKNSANENEINVVSSATCTSKAIISAVAAALKDAAVTEEPGTGDTGNTDEDDTGNTDEDDTTTEPETPTQPDGQEPSETTTSEYVLMNIPYAEFYEAEVRNDISVDIFTSATKNKSRTGTGTMAGGSYHVNSDGSDITGITFPVKVGEGVDLSEYTLVTDESSVDITVTNKGNTSTTTYKGQDALFESASYSYYILNEEPGFYKEVSVDAEGNLKFGEVIGEATTVAGVTTELLTDTSYGDYQLNLEGFDFNTSTDKVYGIVLSTENNDYGLRHLENIWKGVELAWCTGFTDAVHNCPTDSEHYKSMMGQTIKEITYFTSSGIFKIPVNVYIPVKFECSVEIADTDKNTSSAEVTVTGLPEDFNAVYTVEGLDGAAVENGTLTWNKETAKQGQYILTISDKNEKYAEVSADFILTTDEMPAVYSSETVALGKAEA